MKFHDFEDFVSKGDSPSEAERLIKLRREVKRLKRQRLIVTTATCLSTGIIVYLITKL